MSIILLQCNKVFFYKEHGCLADVPGHINLKIIYERNMTADEKTSARTYQSVTLAQLSGDVSLISDFFDLNGSKEVDLVTMTVISIIEITDIG